jgi:hypothetical protein
MDTARAAMIAFLKSGELEPPHPVTVAPRKEATGIGFLTASFDEGTLFLKGSTGEHYRLEWPRIQRAPAADPARKEVSDRRRALPPGEYTLTGYRVVRRDAKAVEWFLSATAFNLCRLIVRADEEQQVQIGDKIHLTGGAHPDAGRVEIQVMLAGEKGSGLSIYRDGKRIEIEYRLLDTQKNELARGTLKYG